MTLPSHPGDGACIEPIPGVEPGELSLRRRAVPSNDRRVVGGVNDGTRTRFLRAHNAVPRRLRLRSQCTRLGSNQQSPLCERGAFPLGHACLVRRARIERATCSVSESRSQPLSYRRLTHSTTSAGWFLVASNDRLRLFRPPLSPTELRNHGGRDPTRTGISRVATAHIDHLCHPAMEWVR